MTAIVLRCVECGAGPLPLPPNGEIRCPSCNRTYRRHETTSAPVLISSRSTLSGEQVFAKPKKASRNKQSAATRHWNTGNLKRLLDSVQGKTLLSYGCGAGADRALLESKGFEVTAFDVFPSPRADFICDGHELPFADAQFDIVTAISVFQYLSDPFQGIREIGRVLKPGGVLIGSVAFLEPQDDRTYFHMTHWGLRKMFDQAGLENIEVYPGWSYKESLNGSFWIWNRLSVIRSLSRRLSRLSFSLGNSLWQAGYRMRGKELPDDWQLRFAGSLIFKAVKGKR